MRTYLTFGDLEGKLDVLRAECPRQFSLTQSLSELDEWRCVPLRTVDNVRRLPAPDNIDAARRDVRGARSR